MMIYRYDPRYVRLGTGGSAGFIAATWLVSYWNPDIHLADLGPLWIYVIAGTLLGCVIGFVTAPRRNTKGKD